MMYLIIALAIVVIFWLISVLIQTADQRAKEKVIRQKLLEKKQKEEKENAPPWKEDR